MLLKPDSGKRMFFAGEYPLPYFIEILLYRFLHTDI
jgi:hypothetical protein